jgi:hypothetical protein
MKSWSEFLESLSDKKRADLLHNMNLIGLKDGDAIFPLLVSLEHYKTFLEDFPADLDKQVNATIAKVTAGATEKAHADLASAVSDTAVEIASRSTSGSRAKWYTISAVISVLLLMCGFYVGHKYAYADVQIRLNDLSKTAAWADSESGKFYKQIFDENFSGWDLNHVKENREGFARLLKWATSQEGLEAWKNSKPPEKKK